MTRRLVLFAHGSTDPRWRRTFEDLAGRMAARTGAGSVDLAYMEFVSPTLMDAAGRAAADGVRSLIVLPLFLSAGGHVARDIPAQADAIRAHFPSLDVVVLSPVGEDPRVAAAIERIASDALDS